MGMIYRNARRAQAPPGFTWESSAITYVNPHCFTVPGDLTSRYKVNSLVYNPSADKTASVFSSVYDGTKTTVQCLDQIASQSMSIMSRTLDVSLVNISTLATVSGVDAQGSYPASNAFDGNANTYYASNSNPGIGTHYFVITFPTARKIRWMGVSQFGGTIGQTSLKLQYFDGSVYVDKGTVALKNVAGVLETFILDEQPTAHTTWKVLSNSVQTGIWGLYEIQLGE